MRSCRQPAEGGRVALVCLAVALGSCAVYLQVQRFGFVNFDDNRYLLGNRALWGGLDAASLRWAFTTRYLGNWHPLTWLSHLVDARLFGRDPRGHHLVNVAFHVGAALLLFLGLRAATGRTWRSGFVAALFALHPLQVESVAWVSERKDVLAGFFWMLTLVCYVGYVRRPGAGRYALVIAACALGALSKPMTVTLPLVLLLLDVWPLGRLRLLHRGAPAARRAGVPPRRLLLEKAPLAALAALTAVMAVLAVREAGLGIAWTTLPLATRIANAVRSYLLYAVKIVWPTDLAVIYPYPAAFPVGRTAAAALALALLTAVALWRGARRPAVAVGWCWFLLTLVPVIGLVQVGTQPLADRYTYLPLVGILLAAVWGAADLAAGAGRAARLLPAAGAILVAASGAMAFRQAGYWADSVTLFRHALAVTGPNAVADVNLGVALRDRGRGDEAKRHFLRALALSPRFDLAHYNLGLALEDEGAAQAALDHYRQSLAANPRQPLALQRAAVLLEQAGRRDEAVSAYRAALALDPEDSFTRYRLALALYGAGDRVGAAAELREVARREPDRAMVQNNLGAVLGELGFPEEAAAHFRAALRLDPDYADARRNLQDIQPYLPSGEGPVEPR